MKLTVYRGTHEIGGSCIEVATDSTRIVLDAGLPLNVDPEALRSADGLKRYRPRVPGLFRGSQEPPSVNAVLLTHFHPDHSAFVDSIHPKIPIYMSKGTQRVMAALRIFLGKGAELGNIVTVNTKPPATVQVGDVEILALLVDHSAPDSLAFVLRADGKTLVYTGDFRAHGRKARMFESFIRRCPRQPDLLLMEGTMVGSHRAGQVVRSEGDLERQLIAIIEGNRKWPLLANFSPTNLDRLVTFLRACKRTDSELVTDLFTTYLYNEMKELGWDIPHVEDSPLRALYFSGHAKALEMAKKNSFLYKMKPAKIEFSELGESRRRIILFRPSHLGTYERKGIRFQGATLVNSQYEGTYPGQEPMMRNFGAYLFKNGIRKLQLHTSGHAFEADLLRFAKAVRPKTLIPIHTCHPEKYENILQGFPVRRLDDGEVANV